MLRSAERSTHRKSSRANSIARCGSFAASAASSFAAKHLPTGDRRESVSVGSFTSPLFIAPLDTSPKAKRPGRDQKSGQTERAAPLGERGKAETESSQRHLFERHLFDRLDRPDLLAFDPKNYGFSVTQETSRRLPDALRFSPSTGGLDFSDVSHRMSRWG